LLAGYCQFLPSSASALSLTPSISGTGRFWSIFRVTRGTLDLPLGYALAAVVLSLGLAVLSWRFVEAPFRRRPPAGPGRAAIFAASGAGTLAICALSLAIVTSGGFPGRVPPDIRAIYVGAEDVSPDIDRCLNRTPGEGLCRLGVAGSSEILLWGDSHAAAIMPGIDAALREAGLGGAAVVASACPPLVGVNRADRGAGLACAAHNDDVVELLRATDDFPTVILFARWALMAEGDRFRGEGGPPALLRSVNETLPFGQAADNYAIFAKAFRRTIDVLRDSGRHVILIDGVPEIGWSVPDRLGDSRFIGSPVPAQPTLDVIEDRNARVNALFAEAATDPRIDRLSLVPELCTPVCAILRDGRPLYHDDDHLSLFAAERLIPPLISSHLIR
jgi:hypothetical protein